MRTPLRRLPLAALAWSSLVYWALGRHRPPVFVHGQTATPSTCKPVEWRPDVLPGYCSVLDTACVDQGARIVTHDDRFQIENVKRQNLPLLPSIVWNLPSRVDAFPDALVGWQPDYAIHLRPVSKAEPTLPLRHPTWSTCTLPVVLLVDYPYNYKTFVIRALTDAHKILGLNGLTPNRDATLVLATPGGLALEPYHAVLLSPYSTRPLITMAELGRRGMEGLPAEWSGEGVRVHCYSKLVVCKLEQHDNIAPHDAAAAVLTHLGDAVPRDPVGFGAVAPLDDPSTLRVLLEARTAPWRTIRNLQEILRACEEANSQGFSAGPFKRIVCKLLPAPYSTTPPAPTTVDPTHPGAASFRAALGAVRSSNLFVAMTGSSGAHAFFMAPTGGGAGGGGAAGGSGLLEVRPCGWGSRFSDRADTSPESMAGQLQRHDDSIRFFAYNVEDPAQCSAPDYEPAVQAAVGSMNPQDTAHDIQRKSPPRFAPGDLLVRDQHVTLRPGPLLKMIRHAAALLADKAAYQSFRISQRLHGYAVPEGVLLGPLGLKDAAQRAQAGPSELIRA